MKNLLSFLKLAALGGLLVLLPILLFILLLMEIVQMVVGLATPIADLFPAGTFDDPKYSAVRCIIDHRYRHEIQCSHSLGQLDPGKDPG